MRRALALACLLAVTASASRGDVRLPRIFTADMVLQRDQPIRVWGWAEPGEDVRVSLADNEATTKADATGQWDAELPARAAGRGLELVVAGRNTIRLGNVAIGDVWLCGGQSNMEWTMAQSDAAADIAAANLPDIRRIKFHHVQSAAPADDAPAATPWQVCSPATAGGFTAVGLFFAREVQAATGVPIGLLDDNWGGTPIEPWIPPTGMELVPDLAGAVTARRQAIEAHRSGFTAHLDALDRWLRTARATVAAGEPLETLPAAPAPPAHPAAGGWGAMSNAMIHPLARFPIKGFLWYQGESNGGEGDSYRHKMQALVGGWRNAWGREDLPFYFVQLASFQNPTDDPAGGDGWARLREAQRHSLAMPRTGMAVIIDTVPLDARGDIHPGNKFDVGARLARWALHHDYGKTDVVPSGPLFKSVAFEEGKARITFDHVGGGLMVGRKEGRAPAVDQPAGTLRRFAIAGEDKKWHWAEAAIDGDTVVVASPAVLKPAAVRYAFSMNPDGANLYNRAGLPASPFRTDDW
jgi:sialate O-acetylesterase